MNRELWIPALILILVLAFFLSNNGATARVQGNIASVTNSGTLGHMSTTTSPRTNDWVVFRSDTLPTRWEIVLTDSEGNFDMWMPPDTYDVVFPTGSNGPTSFSTDPLKITKLSFLYEVNQTGLPHSGSN